MFLFLNSSNRNFNRILKFKRSSEVNLQERRLKSRERVWKFLNWSCGTLEEFPPLCFNFPKRTKCTYSTVSFCCSWLFIMNIRADISFKLDPVMRNAWRITCTWQFILNAKMGRRKFFSFLPSFSLCVGWALNAVLFRKCSIPTLVKIIML